MIDLKDLGKGMPGMTPEKGRDLAQAGAVSLESHGHAQMQPLAVQGQHNGTHPLLWPTVTDQMRRTWADPTEATEDGAVAIAIMLVKTILGGVGR